MTTTLSVASGPGAVKSRQPQAAPPIAAATGSATASQRQRAGVFT
jgi:hypothetical protein